jgi:hypothetical protein
VFFFFSPFIYFLKSITNDTMSSSNDITVFKSAGDCIVVLSFNPTTIPNNLNRGGVIFKDTAKYRCKEAKVVDIYKKFNSNKHLTSVKSDHNPSFIYTINQIVKVDDYDDENDDDVCSTGIHFFLTEDAAYHYNLLQYISSNFNGRFVVYEDNGRKLYEYLYEKGRLIWGLF